MNEEVEAARAHARKRGCCLEIYPVRVFMKTRSAAHTSRMPRHVPHSAGSSGAGALASKLKAWRSEIDDVLKESLRVGLGEREERIECAWE